MAEDKRIGLHNLEPARGTTQRRKRVGRGKGSGHGKTSGRGHKGYGARSGAKKKLAYEGGQNPIHMRMRKLSGPKMKKSMPSEMFRTETQPVNVGRLNGFKDGEVVTPELLAEHGLAKKKSVPVKVLSDGEIERKLTIKVHGVSARAKEKIEAAGGSVELIGGQDEATDKKPKKRKKRKKTAESKSTEDAEEVEKGEREPSAPESKTKDEVAGAEDSEKESATADSDEQGESASDQSSDDADTDD